MSPIELDEHTWRGLEFLESVSGPGAIAELVESFRQDGPERLIRMRSALRAGDLAALSKLAHDLKSNSGTVGATRLFALAEWLERTAREGADPGLGPVLEEVAALLPEVLSALDERAKSYPA